MGKCLDIKEVRFGRLVAIKRIQKPENYNRITTKWECVCDCGNSIIVALKSLRVGDTKSCGCITKELNKINSGEKSVRWKGYEEISGKQFCWIKSGAKKRGIPFHITPKDIWEKYINQSKKCYLTGREISFLDNNVSVDRIDSNKGYTMDNIGLCFKIVNRMKSVLSVDEFITLCHEVCEHNRL